MFCVKQSFERICHKIDIIHEITQCRIWFEESFELQYQSESEKFLQIVFLTQQGPKIVHLFEPSWAKMTNCIKYIARMLTVTVFYTYRLLPCLWHIFLYLWIIYMMVSYIETWFCCFYRMHFIFTMYMYMYTVRCKKLCLPPKGRGTLFLVWIPLASAWHFLDCTISHERVGGF